MACYWRGIGLSSSGLIDDFDIHANWWNNSGRLSLSSKNVRWHLAWQCSILKTFIALHKF